MWSGFGVNIAEAKAGFFPASPSRTIGRSGYDLQPLRSRCGIARTSRPLSVGSANSGPSVSDSRFPRHSLSRCPTISPARSPAKTRGDSRLTPATMRLYEEPLNDISFRAASAHECGFCVRSGRQSDARQTRRRWIAKCLHSGGTRIARNSPAADRR